MAEDKTSVPHKYKLESGRSRKLRQRNKPVMPPLALFLESTHSFSSAWQWVLAAIASCPDCHCSPSITVSFPSLLQTPETSDFTEKTAIRLTVSCRTQLLPCFGPVMAYHSRSLLQCRAVYLKAKTREKGTKVS